MKWLILILSLCACAPREESLPPQVEEPRSDIAATPPSGAAYVWRDEALTWHAWEEVGAVIGRAQRPLLFYVAGPGCEGLFAAPSSLLKELVEKRYWGVRVDPFLWPDAVRYLRSSGCPSLVIARPDGQIVARATDIPPRHVESYLLRILNAFDRAGDEISSIGPAAEAPLTVDLADVRAGLLSAADPRHGGLFGPQKYVHGQALRFLWHYASASDSAQSRSVVDKAVTAFLHSPLRDRFSGAFALYSYTPDWSQPVGDRDVLNQVDAVQLLVDLGRHAPVDAWVRYVERELFDPATGALRGRQVRLNDGRWWTDERLYADRIASAVIALMRIAEQRDRAVSADIAEKAVDFLLAHCIGEEGEVRHACNAEGPQGLLVDQALVALALQAVQDRFEQPAVGDAMRRVVGFAESQLYAEEQGTFSAGWRWPVAEDFSVADDGYPVGNALMAEWYYRQNDRARAEALVERARFLDGQYRVAAHWSLLQVAYGESERQ